MTTESKRNPNRKQFQLEHYSSTPISTKNKTSNTTHTTIKTIPNNAGDAGDHSPLTI